MTQDLFYYESGYIDDSYFVYTADAEATVTSSSSLTATIGVIKEVSSNLEANFTQTSIISHIEGADLFAMSSAALSADANRIRDTNIFVTSAYTITADVERTRLYSAAFDSMADIAVSEQRVRFSEAAIDAAFSSESIANRLRSTQIDLTSSIILTVIGEVPSRIVEAAADLSSSSNISFSGGFLKEANITCDSLFTPNIECSLVKKSPAELTSSFSITIEYDRVRDATSTLTDSFTLGATLSLIKELASSLTNESSLATDTASVRGFDSALTSQSSLSATANRTQELQASFTSASFVDVSIGKIVQLQSDEYSLFSPSVVCNAVRNSFAVLESTATVSAVSNVTKTFVSTISSQSTVSAITTKFKNTSSILEATTSLSAPYLSFSNKHPHSLSYVGTPSTGTGITTAQKYKGTYSYYTGSGSDTNNSLQILGTNSTVIASGQDFYINTWIRPTSLGSVAGTTDNYLLQGYDWAVGYRVSGGNTFASFYYKTNTTTFTRLSVVAPGYLEVNRWNQIEVKRSGSTITLTIYNNLNGATSATATYGGLISDSRTIDTPVYFNALQGTYGVYYDEIFFAKGVSTVSTYTSLGAIDDGALTTTEWLFNFENGYQDQTTGTVKANAVLTSSSSLTALTTLNKTALASLNSASTVAASVTRIKQADATLSSNGFVAVAIGRIRPFVDIEVATFTLTAEGNKTKQASATLLSTADLTTQLVKIADAQSNLTVNSSLDVSFVHNVEFISTESSAFSLSCDINRLRGINASLENTVDLTALPEVTRTTSAELITNAIQVIEYTRIQETTISAQAFASELVVLAKVLRSFANLEINSTLTAVISVTSSRIKADLVANCSVNIDADKISGLTANLASQSALLAITGVKVSFSANLSCQGFVLSTGTVVNLDDSAVWIVPYENTIWQVTEESQTEEIIYLVPTETRTWVISKETNDYEIAFEDRSYKLRG